MQSARVDRAGGHTGGCYGSTYARRPCGRLVSDPGRARAAALCAGSSIPGQVRREGRGQRRQRGRLRDRQGRQPRPRPGQEGFRDPRRRQEGRHRQFRGGRPRRRPRSRRISRSGTRRSPDAFHEPDGRHRAGGRHATGGLHRQLQHSAGAPRPGAETAQGLPGPGDPAERPGDAGDIRSGPAGAAAVHHRPGRPGAGAGRRRTPRRQRQRGRAGPPRRSPRRLLHPRKVSARRSTSTSSTWTSS